MSLNPMPRTTISAATAVRVPEHVVHRSFAAETVVLDLRDGKYHGLNPTGGRMLIALEQCGAVGTAAEQLAREYNQPPSVVTEDLCRFCEELVGRGLIEVVVPRP